MCTAYHLLDKRKNIETQTTAMKIPSANTKPRVAGRGSSCEGASFFMTGKA
jgi:hypothetical protein